MRDQIYCLRISAIEIALLTKFLHQELSDLYPSDPVGVLIISHVILAKVSGEGGLEPSQLSEIPGIDILNTAAPKIDDRLDSLKQDGWILYKAGENLLVPGDIFQVRGNATIDHLNRMINRVYTSLHRNGDGREEVKRALETDKLIKSMWDKESADNDVLPDFPVSE